MRFPALAVWIVWEGRRCMEGRTGMWVWVWSASVDVRMDGTDMEEFEDDGETTTNPSNHPTHPPPKKNPQVEQKATTHPRKLRNLMHALPIPPTMRVKHRVLILRRHLVFFWEFESFCLCSRVSVR